MGKTERSSAERDAHELFETHAQTALAVLYTTTPTDDDLATMAKSFRVARFLINEGEDNLA